YDELIALHPLHPLVQLAMTKRALLRIYQLDEKTPLLTRYKQAVKESSQVTEPGARRDYMLMLANVSVRLNQPEEVTLGHLLEAELCKNFRPRSLADLYVRIGGFAEAAGKKALAKEY